MKCSITLVFYSNRQFNGGHILLVGQSGYIRSRSDWKMYSNSVGLSVCEHFSRIIHALYSICMHDAISGLRNFGSSKLGLKMVLKLSGADNSRFYHRIPCHRKGCRLILPCYDFASTLWQVKWRSVYEEIAIKHSGHIYLISVTSFVARPLRQASG